MINTNLTTHTQNFTLAQTIALFCGTMLVLLLAMYYRLGMERGDDGAFFLRYAENMLKGEFWVWNLGEAPVWGASAPLYPLIIALTITFGFSPETAIIAVGLTLSSISLAAVTFMLGHHFGTITGLVFLIFSVLDTGMMHLSGAGLETPLTIALITFALWTLLYKSNAWVIGVAAGLLMVNKFDLIPVGGLLLLAHWLVDKRFPKVAVIVTSIIAITWYGFAWWYFGAPVPNSFLTKLLYQNNLPKKIDWTWFGSFVFGAGIHKWLTGLSVFALWRKERVLLPLLVMLGGTLLVHLITYTVKYPFEPYNWYAMPAVFSLLVCAAIGVGSLSEIGMHWIPNKVWISQLVASFIVILVFYLHIHPVMLSTEHIKKFASHQEFDRAEAGRWVAANTPEYFVVFTAWGNPAFYSHRKVLDGSFLNRKFENANIIKKYRPEILILRSQGGTPMNPVFTFIKNEGYKVVKVFDKTYSAGIDYFFAVLAHTDVLDKIRNIDPPRNLMSFVHEVTLGDKCGTIKPQGLGTFFIHPGATTVTTFQFDANGYLGNSTKWMLGIHARMAPNVPEAAVKRGAATVRLQILQGEKSLIDDIVKVGESIQRNLPIADKLPLRFIIDNNGNADTDWLLLSMH